MKKSIVVIIFTALYTLTASMNTLAHPGHEHTANTVHGLVLLAVAIGIGVSFYCLRKARNLQLLILNPDQETV